ncbi:PaaI family thioesterase [Henriciella mobilis]|nr:hotdog fold thioesterase [Henriciella mobilis]
MSGPDECRRSEFDPLEISQTMLSSEGLGPSWGVEVRSASLGRVTIALRTVNEMTNGFGMVHGGVIFALADSAFAYAANSENELSVGQSATIEYIRPARIGEVLIATAEMIADHGRSAVYRISVTNEEGEAVAVAQARSRRLGKPTLPMERPE